MYFGSVFKHNQSVIILLKLLFLRGAVFIFQEKQTTADYFCFTKKQQL